MRSVTNVRAMNSTRRAHQSILASSLALALAACGGGGGGGGGNTPTPPPNPPVQNNTAPTVNAGTDQSTELPGASLQLSGTATDDNLPAGSSLTYRWSAPADSGITFASEAAATTTATFTVAGTFDLTLTVSDGQLSATDTVRVTVNPPVFPGADWTDAAPADVGMNAAKLDEARAYAESGGGSGFIARKGRRVYTWGDQSVNYDVKSTSKSLGGIALGLAMAERNVSLNDLATTHMPTFAASLNDPRTSTITLLQLATHTAGFPKDGGEQPLIDPPGTTWRYSDGSLNWLADVLTYVYQDDLSNVISTRVFSRLGIARPGGYSWRDNEYRSDTLDVGGTPVKRREFASGILIDVPSMARVGQLFLREGQWEGEQILSREFIELVSTPRPENATLPIREPVAGDFPRVTENYGVLWWTNATGMLQGVPTDAYWAWGLYDNLLVIIPSLDLVIVRGGPANNDPSVGTRNWNDGQWNGDYAVLEPFLRPIVESVTQ